MVVYVCNLRVNRRIKALDMISSSLPISVGEVVGDKTIFHNVVTSKICLIDLAMAVCASC